MRTRSSVQVVIGVILLVLSAYSGFTACKKRYKYTPVSSITGNDTSGKCAICGAPGTWVIVPEADPNRVLEYRCDKHRDSDDPGAKEAFVTIFLGIAGIYNFASGRRKLRGLPPF